MRFDRIQKSDSHRPSPNTERDYTKEARRENLGGEKAFWKG